MVNDHGTVHGGFTLLVERRKMSVDEAGKLDELLIADQWVDL